MKHKLLIVSDSHGLTNELKAIRKRHRDVDVALHCGDSELGIDSRFLSGYMVVKGNCDWQAPFPNDELIEIGGLTILMTHGHLFDVKSSLLQLQYHGLEKEADIVCFGHSHIAFAEKIDQLLYINPGSIRLPKKFPDPSYVIVEWATLDEVTVRFYHVDGEEIVSFPYETQFNLK